MAHNYEDNQIKEARKRLWQKGLLSWKLDHTQKELYNQFQSNDNLINVWLCSRRLGKSYALCIIALEQCLQHPGSIIKFLQPEQKQVRQNVKPIMNLILRDCPPEILPRFKTQDNVYEFPNGSEIQLAGSDINPDKLRGGDAHICLVDEAGLCNALDYIIQNVLIPTTTIVEGRIILSTTPPEDAGHDFFTYMEQAELQESLIVRTIEDALEAHESDDNPRITQAKMDKILKALPGGKDSSAYKREYLCQITHNSERSVVPEFTPEIEEDILVSWPKPKMCDRYIAMDIGFSDLTVALFAYYDFENAVTVIEDEVVMSGPKMTTDVLAQTIMDMERKLWTNIQTGEFMEPYRRVCDNNLIVINDLQRLHNLIFFPTMKDNKEAAINNMRMEIANRQVYINPRCKTLIHHLRRATWSKSRKTYTRSPDSGHYDAVDALIYLLRNIDKNRNPYPPGYRSDKFTMDRVFRSPNDRPTTRHDEFKSLFNLRKPLKS